MDNINDSYRAEMDGPLDSLAVSIWGRAGGGPAGLRDPELVSIAAKKINTLKKIILASGFNEDMLKAIMEE